MTLYDEWLSRRSELEQLGAIGPTNQKEKTDMENQHRKIKGYRELTEDEIAAMNKGKALEQELLKWMASLAPPKSHGFESDPADDRPVKADGRWLAIAKTQLQQGFMALARSIARPEGF